MKCLTFFQIDVLGGFSKRLTQLIETLHKSSYEVHYISTKKICSKGKFHKISESKRFNKNVYLRYSILFLSIMINALDITRKEEIDKIIVFGEAYGFIGAIIKMIFGTQLIVFIRGNWLMESTIKKRNIYLIKFIQKIVYKSADKIITNSEDMKNNIVKQYDANPKKISVVYNNIPEKARPQKKRVLNNYIGYVGTLDKVKNVDLLILGFSKANINKKLAIIGTGPDEEKLKRLTETLGIKNKIIFFGWVDNAIPIISSLDLLILPSQSEGCPNVVLEALGCETPCIGSNVGGIREVLKYDELLFKVNDSDAIAEKLEYVFENYKTIKKLCMIRKKEFEFDWGKRVVEIVR